MHPGPEVASSVYEQQTASVPVTGRRRQLVMRLVSADACQGVRANICWCVGVLDLGQLLHNGLKILLN